MSTFCRILVSAAIVMPLFCLAQNPPENWKTATSLEVLTFGGLDLPHNSPQKIREELLDPTLLKSLAKLRKFSDRDLATVKIAKGFNSVELELFQLGDPDTAFTVLSEDLGVYVSARAQGHTREFVMESLTNRIQQTAFTNSDYRLLMLDGTLLAPSRMRKAASGVTTNTIEIPLQTGTTNKVKKATMALHSRWVTYVAVDGPVAWSYEMQFNPDGSLLWSETERCDPKDYDPQFSKS